jgi:hypothetical protein
MAEWRMAKVMRETQSLREVFIQAESACDRPTDLRYFKAVCEPDPEMVVVRSHEDLRFVPQPTEGDGVDDPIAIPLKNISRAPRPVVALQMKAAARF